LNKTGEESLDENLGFFTSKTIESLYFSPIYSLALLFSSDLIKLLTFYCARLLTLLFADSDLASGGFEAIGLFEALRLL
jgi:hypothetical protein